MIANPTPQLCHCGEKPVYQRTHHCPACEVESYGCGGCWLCGATKTSGSIPIRYSSTGIADTLGATA